MAPAGGWHGGVAMEIGRLLANFVRQTGAGKVFAAETGYRLPDPEEPENPPTVRAPDASFIPAARAHIAREKGYVKTPPDLAVEVHSPDDRVGEIGEKTRWWLTRGVLEVWNVDPVAETIIVHRGDAGTRLFRRGEVAVSMDALPRFEVDLDELFDDA